MISLYRARLALVAAVVVGALLLGLELPISTLLHQQRQLAQASGQLATVEARNAALQADVAALRENSAIAAIAHEEYGLVQPGQRSYVILPSSTDSLRTGALGGDTSIPASDLVLGPVEPASTPSTDATAVRTPGLAQRVLSRLEFWRWAF